METACARPPAIGMPIKLRKWFRVLRGPRPPEEIYVDSATVPAEPEGPYRARLEAAAQQRTVAGVDVGEREVVAGEWLAGDQLRCPCGHRWQGTEVQRMNLCPQCGRAVLVEVPSHSID
jgi:hypothetical protein